MKKHWLIIALLVSIFALTACNTTDKTDENEVKDKTTTEASESESGEKPVKELDLDLEEVYKNKQFRVYAEKFLNTKATDFTLTNLNGEEVSLSDYDGQNVILEFAYTKCSVCKDIQPSITQYKATNNDVPILQVFPFDSSEQIQSFLTETNTAEQVDTSLVLTNDKENSVAKDYKVDFTPIFMFIDKNGFIGYVHIGGITPEKMDSIKNLLYEE